MSSLYLEWRAAERRKATIAAISQMSGPRLADPRITEPAWRRFLRLVLDR